MVSAQAVPPRSSFVDLDGPTHYVDFGGPVDGPLVVCVHGLGGSHVNWLAVGPALAEHARVLAVDLAGHGLSPAAGRETTVPANQELLDRFLTQVSGTPAVLVGNSMGGMISLLEADRHPEHVAGMVLIDPALPRARGGRPDALVARTFAMYAMPVLGTRFLARRRQRFTPEQLVGLTLAMVTVEPARVPRHVVDANVALIRQRSSQPGMDKAFLEAARSVLAVGMRSRVYNETIRRVRPPVLLLQGAEDRLVPLGAAREAARMRPDWRLEVREGIGHVPQLEDPEWTAATILDWLGREGSAAAAAAAGASSPATAVR